MRPRKRVRSRRCLECEGWFPPDARAAESQVTCSEECRLRRRRHQAVKRRQRDVGRAREAEAGRQRKCRALKRAAGGPAPAPLEVEPLTEAVLSTLEEFLVAKLGQLPSRALMQRAAESLAERAERPER